MPAFIELHRHKDNTPYWVNIDHIVNIYKHTIETTVSTEWVVENYQEIFDKIKAAYNSHNILHALELTTSFYTEGVKQHG